MRCDMCQLNYEQQGIAVPLTEIEQIARNGFGPHEHGTSITVESGSLMGTSLFMRERYVSAEESNEWWRRRILANDKLSKRLIKSLRHRLGWRQVDDKPWLLCHKCYQATRRYALPKQSASY
jgi:hypothetical protein